MIPIKCSKCGTLNEVEPHSEVAFCSECGGELVLQKQPSDEPVKKPEDYTSLMDRLAKQVKPASAPVKPTPPPNRKSDWNLSEISLQKASQSASEFTSSAKTDCPYLEVLYNANRFLLSGVQVPLELKITQILKGVRELFIWFAPLIAGDKGVASRVTFEQSLSFGKTIALSIPFNPGEKVAGLLPFRFYFGCLLEDEVKYYQMNVEHQVYTKEQSGDSIAKQIVMNISASEAGSVNANIADAAKELQGKNLSANDLIRKLNNEPSKFSPAALVDTRWRPENHIISGKPYPSEKLTLLWKNERIQLVCKSAVKFGRMSETSDIAVRFSSDDCGPNDHPNNTVSRKHAEIQYCGDSVILFDCSRFGTYISEKKPTSSGCPLPNEALVEFGDIHWKMEMQHCDQREESSICNTCPARRIKSITFKRKDKQPESYALVWQCCELGYLYKELAGWTVIRRNGAFALRTPDQKIAYLVPGKNIECNGVSIKANRFEQI